MLGGPFGDRIGRKRVIWFSILGTLPFTLALPYASLFWTGPLMVIIGLILASAFPAIVVFAQELVPGKVGMISGLFFGLAFGMGGLGAAGLGCTRRCHRHRTRLRPVRVLAADRPAGGASARPRAAACRIGAADAATARGARRAERSSGDSRPDRRSSPDANECAGISARLEDRFFAHRLVRLCADGAVRQSGVPQPLHTERRRARFQLPQPRLALHEPAGIGLVGVQKYGHCQTQAFEQLRMHHPDRLQFIRRQRLAALLLLDGGFHQAVRNDVAHMLDVDDGRQDILQPRAFPGVVESLLTADRDQIAANAAAKPANARSAAATPAASSRFWVRNASSEVFSMPSTMSAMRKASRVALASATVAESSAAVSR